ncbi:uncharacterized protein METZ01_LOCUS108964 [marine metagenome]|uniref:Uncharacterized protein n=1 Tax=marine metagenome TaxID=408172 RepID=A0A381WUG6_9ZZZZ
MLAADTGIGAVYPVGPSTRPVHPVARCQNSSSSLT